MVFFMKGILLVFLFSVASVVSAEDVLRFSYWDDAKPPFVIQREGVVSSGIIKDLADKIAEEFGSSVDFVKLPVGRIEEQLDAGAIDIDCLTSPRWKNTPSLYNWSPVLFKGADRFLAQAEFASKLNAFSDLKGATLGIYNAYVYHPEIMKMIASGEVSTIKVKGVEHGIQLLQLKRLDALIDFGLLLKYQIREKSLGDQLVLAELPADEFDLHCAFSKKMAGSPVRLNAAFDKLIQEGQITQILRRYR